MPMMLAPAFARMGHDPQYYSGYRNTRNFISFVRKLLEGFYRL